MDANISKIATLIVVLPKVFTTKSPCPGITKRQINATNNTTKTVRIHFP